jgi:predicted S18 family serine protease
MNILSNLSVQSLKLAVAIKQKIEDLEHELTKVLKSADLPVSISLTVKRRNGMSVAGRAKIAAAQTKRWAKLKGKTEKPAKRGRKKMSASARAKIAAAAKARWAKVKAAGKSRL